MTAHRSASLRDQRGYLARALRVTAWVALLTVLSAIPARAQTEQVWPEVSTFVKMNDRMRFYFLATTVKETRESTEGEFGPNFDFYFKPLRKKHIAWHLFSPDESKTKLVTLRVGYRYIHPFTGDNPDEHRGVLELTTRHGLPGSLLASDRNRMDLRSVGGEYSWRYRNRLTLEREFSAGRFKLTPYSRGEIYYDSRYDKVSRTSLIGGLVYTITRHFELEGYFEHQNDSGGSSNRTVNAVGLVINLYF